ncbi:MAG: hypothetical protein P8129_24420 [Anaerolineae bacterium]
MDDYVRVYRIAPLPDVDPAEFESFFVESVSPAVNTGPTRGGQISRSSLLKDLDAERKDRYLWLVYWRGTNARWVEDNLKGAIDKLQSVGILLSSSVLQDLG